MAVEIATFPTNSMVVVNSCLEAFTGGSLLNMAMAIESSLIYLLELVVFCIVMVVRITFEPKDNSNPTMG